MFSKPIRKNAPTPCMPRPITATPMTSDSDRSCCSCASLAQEQPPPDDGAIVLMRRGSRLPHGPSSGQQHHHQHQHSGHCCSSSTSSPQPWDLWSGHTTHNPMAMVGSSPVTTASRPSWSSAPQTATPPEAEEPQSNAASKCSLHGAIGDRRNSRSSSVSSAESNGGTNSQAEQQETGRRLTSSRGEETPMEQHAKSILQHLDMQGSDSSGPESLGEPNKEKAVTPPSDPQLGLRNEVGSDANDLVSQFGLMGTASSASNPLQLGHLMDGQKTEPSAFSAASGSINSGRPVTASASRLGPFNPNKPLEMVNVVNGFVQDFNTGIQGDFDMMGFQNFADKYAPGNDIGSSLSAGFTSANSSQGFSSANPSQGFSSMGGGASGSYGSSHGAPGQPFMSSNTSNAFPAMGGSVFSGNQSMALSNRGGNNFYNPQAGFGSNSNNFFPGHSNNYFSPSQMPPFQGFTSQDFTMPPPSHSWNGSSFSPEVQSTHMSDRVICKGCTKFMKWPLTLDCMHVFCFNCVCSKVNTTTKIIMCPYCNRGTSVEGGVQKLLMDYTVCRYMLKAKLNPFACTSCTRDSEAIITCTSCPAYLCAECHEGHRSMRIFANHNLTPITKVMVINGEVEPMCDKHLNEPTVKYCVTCAIVICEKCTVDHSHSSDPAHNNHDLVDAYNISVVRMRTWNEDSLIKTKEVSEIKKKVPEMKNMIETKKRIARRNVDEYTEYCKNVMEQNRAHSHEMIERGSDQMESHLARYSKLIDELNAELEAVSSFNCFAVDEGTPEIVMKSLSNMESGYKHTVSEYSDICQKNNGEGMTFEVTFNPDYPRTNEFIQENFQAITYKINDVEFPVQPVSMRPDLGRSRNFTDFGSSDNPDCNYQRWSAAPDSMSISTWNSGNERDRKGTFIPYLNRCRTRTSFVHVFGDYGRGEYAFTEPSGQAYFEDGSYVICDTNNHRIVYYNKDHEFVRSIGQPPNLPALAEDHEMGKGGPRGKGFTRQDGYLYFPNRVAICPVTKHIVATERPPSHDVQIFTIDGDFVRCFGGSVLQHPRGVTVDENGVIIVVECKVMKLTMFNHDGTQLATHSLAKDLEFPNDVAAKDGKIYISDNRGHCVQVFDYDAKFLQKIGNDSITYFPIGVSINYLNQVVVTDNHNTFNITVFDLEGRVLNIFESITKHAQCHNVSVHPTKMELMLTTKDCNVYFFNYDPNAQHPPVAPTSRGPSNFLLARRARTNGNGGGHSSSNYY